jgi:hypothetical protein
LRVLSITGTQYDISSDIRNTIYLSASGGRNKRL